MNWFWLTPCSTACTIGHCGVVSFQRRSVSAAGKLTTVPRPRSACSAPSSTNTRLHTISPGLPTPFSEPPPSGKYIGGCRSLLAPAYPSTKWLAGAAPEICSSHTKSSRPSPFLCSPQRTSCSVVDGSSPSALQQRFVTSASTPAHSSTSLKCTSGPPG